MTIEAQEDWADAVSRELAAIEARRREIGIGKEALERLAQIARGHYGRLLGRDCLPRRGMIARLKLALQRHVLRQAADTDTDLLLTLSYRMAIAIAAHALDRDPAICQGQDPARRATASADWSAAAEVRNLAFYLMNSGAGMKQATIARAAGVTRQAVSLACQKLEDRRDDPKLDRLLDELTAAIMGEW